MDSNQILKANEIKEYLEKFDFIKSCEISGSLKEGSSDCYSDIDLRINVNGSDNGKVLLMLPQLLSKKFEIIYTAFAPRFAPDLYIVSFGFKNMDIFHFVDIECIAEPHIASLSKEEIKQINNMKSLKLKLYIGLLKKILRNKDISDELSFFLKKKITISNSKKVLKDEFYKLYEIVNTDMKSLIKKGLEYLETIK